jgi:ATP-dependent Lon protease
MVLLPFENQDNYDEIPEDIKKGLEVRFVKHIDEILNEVLL